MIFNRIEDLSFSRLPFDYCVMIPVFTIDPVSVDRLTVFGEYLGF